jgi:hypothetical protein
MKKIILILSLLFVTMFSVNTVKAATATPTSYINTIYSVMLCGAGSTATACANPVVLGSTFAGTTFDLASITAGASAGSMGDTSVVEPGQTFGFMQVILDRSFTMKATGSDGDTTCYTAINSGNGTASSLANPAFASTSSGDLAAQVIRIPDNSSLDANMHGTNHIDGNTIGDDASGILSAKNYVGFIVTLETPFTMPAGNMPAINVAFSLTDSANFFEAGGSDCAITPSAPSVKVTFNK